MVIVLGRPGVKCVMLLPLPRTVLHAGRSTRDRVGIGWLGQTDPQNRSPPAQMVEGDDLPGQDPGAASRQGGDRRPEHDSFGKDSHGPSNAQGSWTSSPRSVSP